MAKASHHCYYKYNSDAETVKAKNVEWYYSGIKQYMMQYKTALKAANKRNLKHKLPFNRWTKPSV